MTKLISLEAVERIVKKEKEFRLYEHNDGVDLKYQRGGIDVLDEIKTEIQKLPTQETSVGNSLELQQKAELYDLLMEMPSGTMIMKMFDGAYKCKIFLELGDIYGELGATPTEALKKLQEKLNS